MLDLLRTSPVGRIARRLRWSLAPDHTPTTLAGRLSVRTALPVAEAGVAANWVVRVENHSRKVWSKAGPLTIGLRHQWFTRTGKSYGEPIITPLPQTLMPGDWADMSVPVQGPTAVGDFTLTWSLAATNGISDSLIERLSVPVTFPRTTDIDYHHVYRSADLEANSWWVVGAYHSQEEFFRSANARREMLIEQGLTPDSRLLDVGCGTGQMAMGLEKYLSDRGAYYGTDIGREGIEFAKRTYRRSNFVFETGGMTTIPFTPADGPFDMAIYFSVFTHTFLDESALLLSQTQKLLAPRGVVIADVITSDLVERGAGHRGQMWVNRGYFLRLAETVGLRGTVFGTVPWANDAERVMIRFEKAA